jgi:hypothetical protein
MNPRTNDDIFFPVAFNWLHDFGSEDFIGNQIEQDQVKKSFR